MKTEDDELEPELKAFLRQEATPGDLLEERVVRALKAKGILRSSRPVTQIARIAAALLLFLSGLVVGQWTARHAEPQATPQAAKTSPARPPESEMSRQLYWF